MFKQLAGEWEVNSSTLIEYHKEAKKLVENFANINFEHIPRVVDVRADRLLKLDK